MPPVRKRRANLETNTVADDRRTAMPESPPDSLPPRDEDKREMTPVGGGFTPKEDGGVDQHPVHDDDQEDKTASDYEHELDRLDAAARSER